MFDFHRHAVIFQIRADSRLRVELPAFHAFLTQRNPRPQCGGETFHLALQYLFICIGKCLERTVHQVVNIILARMLAHILGKPLPRELLNLFLHPLHILLY